MAGIDVRLLLDTVTFIHAVESPQRLSSRARAVLEDNTNTLEFSAISLSEIAIKTALRKLNVTAALARQALADMNMHVLPFTGSHAFGLFELPMHHRDPFDRQIIAQAMSEGIPVVSPDAAFKQYKGLKIVW